MSDTDVVRRPPAPTSSVVVRAPWRAVILLPRSVVTTARALGRGRAR